MQTIAGALTKKYPNLVNRIGEVKSKFNSHPVVQELNKTYPNNNLSKGDIQQYITDQENCRSCPGLSECKNMMAGHRLTVINDEDWGPNMTSVPCDLHEAWYRQQKIKKHVKSHHVPAHILNTTFSDLDLDAGRKAAIAASMKFCKDFERGKATRGLYLQGPFGSGKSAIVGAIANELAKRDVDVVVVYVSEFLQEIKSSIKSNTVEEKLEAMKKVSVLILDDIGAEGLTIWTRDEVLGPILHSRMEVLPTIFTSNLTLRELENHLSLAKDERSPNIMKGARIMERIEPFVDKYQVTGPNRRRGES